MQSGDQSRTEKRNVGGEYRSIYQSFLLGVHGMKTLIRAIFFIVYLFFYILIGTSLGTTPIKNQSNENKMNETEKAVPKPFNGNAKWIWTSTGTRNPKNHILRIQINPFDNFQHDAHKKLPCLSCFLFISARREPNGEGEPYDDAGA